MGRGVIWTEVWGVRVHILPAAHHASIVILLKLVSCTRLYALRRNDPKEWHVAGMARCGDWGACEKERYRVQGGRTCP